MAQRYVTLFQKFGSGTRDLIRSGRQIAITAAGTVLDGHPYRSVIESLSKSKFGSFLL